MILDRLWRQRRSRARRNGAKATEHTPDLERVRRNLPAYRAWNGQKLSWETGETLFRPVPAGSGSAPAYKRQHREAVGSAVVFNLLLERLVVGFTMGAVNG